jgi:hypothetical protein
VSKTISKKKTLVDRLDAMVVQLEKLNENLEVLAVIWLGATEPASEEKPREVKPSA